MRFANDTDPSKATEWIDLLLPVAQADPSWPLAGYQRAVLQSALDALNAEIQAAHSALDRVRG